MGIIIQNKEMKACIIGIMNLKHMTMMSLYTSYFEENDIAYDVIYMDEYGIDEECNAEKVYKYTAKKDSDSVLLNRIQSRLHYIGFKRYCCNILKKNKYDFLVIWREETAILLAEFLARNYTNSYSVNIRDIDICIGKRKESNLKKLELAVLNSAFNTVSSNGFIKYLPKAKYLFVHSANDSLLSKQVDDIGFSNQKKEKIIISNVGTFRNDEYCFKVADSFANDLRFELRFIGQGSERMEEYAKQHGYKNIYCTGGFEPKDTLNMLLDADIINCAYGNDSIAETTKLPIRFYYAVYLGLPVLVTKDTWIETTSNEMGLGISIPSNIKEEELIAEEVYLKYTALNKKDISNKTKEYIVSIEKSHEELEYKIGKIFGC